MPGWIAKGAARRMQRMRAEEQLRMLNLLKVGTGSVSAEDAQQFVRYLMGEAELQRSSKRASISDLKSMGISVEIK